MADTLFKENLEKVKRKKIVGNNISWKFSKIASLILLSMGDFHTQIFRYISVISQGVKQKKIS